MDINNYLGILRKKFYNKGKIIKKNKKNMNKRIKTMLQERELIVTAHEQWINRFLKQLESTYQDLFNQDKFDAINDSISTSSKWFEKNSTEEIKKFENQEFELVYTFNMIELFLPFLLKLIISIKQKFSKMTYCKIIQIYGSYGKQIRFLKKSHNINKLQKIEELIFNNFISYIKKQISERKDFSHQIHQSIDKFQEKLKRITQVNQLNNTQHLKLELQSNIFYQQQKNQTLQFKKQTVFNQ